MLYTIYPPLIYVKIKFKKCQAFANETAKTIRSYLVEGGGIQHFQINHKFWHYATNRFDL